jgi:N-acetylglutamate synthase-like GNAT family acetyltransferase
MGFFVITLLNGVVTICAINRKELRLRFKKSKTVIRKSLMTFIQATYPDAAELVALVNSAYRGESSLQGWTTESHLLDGIRIDEPTMREYLQARDTVILKHVNDEGNIIACVYLQMFSNKKLYLGMLTVSPNLQAAGIGRRLLLEADIQAKEWGCKTIFMTVISTRTELIDWYKRRGYADTGKREPFHDTKRFGIPRNQEPIELMVLEKEIV